MMHAARHRDDRQRFGRGERLLRRRDYDAVFRCPSIRVSAPPLWLAARPSPTANARLGLIVGKKVLRRAVDRNRAKRVIRESFRSRSGLPVVDVVVRVKAAGPVRKADADRLFRLLQTRLSKR